MQEEKRFAVLIDSDNVSHRYVKHIFDEVSNYGNVTYKRIYGDWTESAGGWKNVLLENSITPMQQYSYTTGKNATDSAMIIDAMDILYSGNVDGFCIVSSDSDFTRLAVRLRESGMTVIGMGERKTPKPFSVACNVFKYLDVLAEEESAGSESTENMTDLDTILNAVVNIVTENGDEEKGLSIGEVGTHLLKRYPDFDVRNYGYTKLSKFLSSFDCLELTKTRHSVYIQLRESHNELDEVVSAIFDYLDGRDEAVNLGQLNEWLMEEFPRFNVKNYGFSKFVKFVSSIEGLHIRCTGRNGQIKYIEIE